MFVWCEKRRRKTNGKKREYINSSKKISEELILYWNKV